MPLVDWNSATSYAAAYDIGAEPEGYPSARPEIRLHFHRAVLWPDAQARAGKYADRRMEGAQAGSQVHRLWKLGCRMRHWPRPAS